MFLFYILLIYKLKNKYNYYLHKCKKTIVKKPMYFLFFFVKIVVSFNKYVCVDLR